MAQITISKLQDLLWDKCRILIRYRDGRTCVACGATGLQGSNQQTGHFIADSVSGAYLRYDLRNLGIQCMRCNIRLSGNGAFYGKYLKEKHGQKFIDQLFIDKNQKSVKAYSHYEMLLKLYTRIVDKLPNVDKNILNSPCELLLLEFPEPVAEIPRGDTMI